MNENYYDVLDIPYNASSKMIESAYYSALSLYNSNNLANYSIISSNEIEKSRKLIEEAYLVLSSNEKRNLYDSHKNITHDSEREHSSSNVGNLKKEGAYINNLEATEKFKLVYSFDNELELQIEQEEQYSGSFLKQIREYKNVSLDRMAKLTNILKSYLISIEEERFDLLPATVYARGFVFQYAKILKLNPDLVTKKYISRLKEYRNDKLS